jgi:hypothetical protein
MRENPFDVFDANFLVSGRVCLKTATIECFNDKEAQKLPCQQLCISIHRLGCALTKAARLKPIN